MTLDEITRYVHEHIPITRHLGAAIVAYDRASIRLAAPLRPNLNHRSTAFGGSLSALAILGGWTLLHLALLERGIAAQIVIQRSEMDFDAPVAGDLAVTATLPPAAQWDRFLATLGRHRRARVRVRSTLGATPGGASAGAHEGVYVAIPVEAAGGGARADEARAGGPVR
jgi:thioesterase domain-containing protein